MKAIFASLIVFLSAYVSCHISPNVTFPMDEPTEETDCIYEILSDGIENPYVVCAIMGNMFRESKMQSNLWEGDWTGGKESDKFNEKVNLELSDPDEETKYYFTHWSPYAGHYGFGLCQWTAIERKEQLYDLAVETHRNIDDAALQADFVVWEWENSYEELREELADVEDLWKTTMRIASSYERCAVSEVSYEVRLQAAEYYWNWYVEGLRPDDSAAELNSKE